MLLNCFKEEETEGGCPEMWPYWPEKLLAITWIVDCNINLPLTGILLDTRAADIHLHYAKVLLAVPLQLTLGNCGLFIVSITYWHSFLSICCNSILCMKCSITAWEYLVFADLDWFARLLWCIVWTPVCVGWMGVGRDENLLQRLPSRWMTDYYSWSATFLTWKMLFSVFTF